MLVKTKHIAITSVLCGVLFTPLYAQSPKLLFPLEQQQNEKSGKQALLEKSLGYGNIFSADFTGYTLSSDVPDGYNFDTVSTGIGAYLFYDLTYIELNLGLILSNINSTDSDIRKRLNYQTTETVALRFGSFGKLPIAVKQGFALFPLAGFELELFASAKQDTKTKKFLVADDNEEKADSALTTVWFRAGIGCDYDLSKNIYLRGAFVYGIRFLNKAENYMLERFYIEKIFGHGLNIKAAIGYRLP